MRERFVYGEYIARCTVCWTVWGLEIVVRDEVVVCVQALGNGDARNEHCAWERHQTL